jgi:hypothetical protein
MDEIPEGAELFLSDSHGIYIPQFFAEQVDRSLVTGLDKEDYETLEAGPDGEWYWETWDCVLRDAVLKHPKLGNCYLWQDGDLWVVPEQKEETA